MKRQAKRTVWMALGVAGPLGLCCLLLACGTKVTGDAPDGGADLAATMPRCSEDPLPLQNPRAHTLGETFYLPRPQAAAGCPAQLAWTVVSGPAQSAAKAWAGATGVDFESPASWPRFTPDLPGTYTLQLGDAPGSRLVINAVRRSNAERFRNHYLTPLYGLARVGDELWAANGAAYSVTRLQSGAGGWQKRDEIAVGAWPAALAWRDGLPFALVANRGSDTVGFIDRARGVQDDALWVGDEPTALALSPDGKRAYVSLPTMRQVAVIALDSRTVIARVAVGFDPRALALSGDGARLFVASFRSANLQDGPMGSRKPEDDQDVWVIDTATLAVKTTVRTVSADLRALALSGDGAELYVASTDGDTIPVQSDPNAKPFVHQVNVLGADPAQADRYGKVLRSVDLTRQMGSGGPLVNPGGVLAVGDALFVAGEGNDTVAVLDRATLAERKRVAVAGGPRHLVALADGSVAVHCFRSLEVTLLSATGEVKGRVKLADDPRPAPVALGETVFNRTGAGFAVNHGCASCHIEAETDAMMWRFGPTNYANVRPLQLLEISTPIGWNGYVSNAANFGIQGPSSIIGRPPTQEESEGLSAFLGSLVGAPRATGTTRPDGSYTAAGLRGKELFERKLGCAGCHTPGLYTNRALIPVGKSGEPADVPTLLGVYRHGVYMVKGQARSLDAAVDIAVAYVKATVSASERADLIEFLRELTAKGAAPRAQWPDLDSNQAVGADVQPTMAFAGEIDDSQPGVSAAQAAAPYVTLEGPDGAKVAGEVKVEPGTPGAVLRFVPAKALTAGAKYTLRALLGLPFRDGGVLDSPRTSAFTVAAPPRGALPEKLRMTVTIPPMGPMGMPTAVPMDVDRLPPENGAERLRVTLPGGLTQRLWLQVSDDKVYLQGFALPLGRGVADAGNVVGTVDQVVEQNGAKQIASIKGTLRVGAPGINIPGIPFTITPR